MNTIEAQGRETLQETVDACGSYSAVLRAYGLTASGAGSRTALYRLIDEWEIDLSTFNGNDRYPHTVVTETVCIQVMFFLQAVEEHRAV